MTPRALGWLEERRKIETQAREFLFAQIAQAVVNWGFRAPEKPAKIADFMPSQRRRESAKPRSAVKLDDEGREEIAAGFRRAMALYGVVEPPRE